MAKSRAQFLRDFDPDRYDFNQPSQIRRPKSLELPKVEKKKKKKKKNQKKKSLFDIIDIDE